MVRARFLSFRQLRSRWALTVRTLVVSWMVTVAVAGVVACEDASIAVPCSNIPPGGCPLSRGVACEDPACEAVYLCREGNVWELREHCPPREAGVVDGGSADVASPSPFDAGVYDVPPGAFGGPGCTSLQIPDCSLGLALACGEGCCGCEDLFVCEDRGWNLWGACVDGRITPIP